MCVCGRGEGLVGKTGRAARVGRTALAQVCLVCVRQCVREKDERSWGMESWRMHGVWRRMCVRASNDKSYPSHR